MAIKVEEILGTFNEVKINTRKALRESKVPEPTINLHTVTLADIGFPLFENLEPEQMRGFYQRIKEATIMYFNRKGFSQRAVSRELGGSSQAYVNQFLNSI